MKLLLAPLTLLGCLVLSGCYTSSTVILRNPDRHPNEQSPPLDSEWATLEGSLIADAEVELKRVESMPPGAIADQPGGGWIYRMTESGRSTINHSFCDGGKELERDGHMRDGDILHLLKAGNYSYSIGEIEINRIDSVEVLQRHRQQPKPAAIVVTSVFVGGVVLYLITADHEMQGFRHDPGD